MKPTTALVASTLALAGAATLPAGARDGALVVRASPATTPCVAAVAPAYFGATGRTVAVQSAAIGPVGSANGADVVVAIEEELTRVMEGGESAPGLDLEVATIPWVIVGARGEAPDLQALARSSRTVRVFGGAIGRHARESLAHLSPERVLTERAPAVVERLAPGEVALVPLSLAGPGPVTATAVSPLLVRAVGVRGSPRPDAARAFLEFLASEAGNATFRACGRGGAR